MKIYQAVFGAFHHFELARELERRGHLAAIYSTWPWARLKREGLPRGKVQTFPWLHTPETVLNRFGLLPLAVSDWTGVQNALTFDEWTLKRIPADADALIAIAGAGLKTGRLVQQRGGQFICDRGSTHARWQERVVRGEYQRWGVDLPVSDMRDIVREEEIYATADALTVPSAFALRTYVEMGLPAEKLHVIPYGVRLEAFRPTREPDAGEFAVLFAGGAGLRKGIPYLLQAFALLQHPGKVLRIAGAVQPDLRRALQRLPKEHVEFLGNVPRARLVDLMSRSHALVLPSIEDGFGLVMAEALACGCPVIASTNTGAEELFSDGVEGFVVPICDSPAILERLQQLADDSALQQRMRAAALARVATLGGWADYGDRWERLLRQLTGKT
jgi:glycosyltransferase involved in cell wall biosynthesis